jgi:hypothetical protein
MSRKSGHIHKARPYELECGHNVWFKIVPDIDDIIWCQSCKKETRFIGAAVTQHGRLYQEDFWSEKIRSTKNSYRGGCLSCDYEWTSSQGWFVLRDHMHEHYIRTHTRFGATLVIKEVKYPSQPPF